MRGRTPKRKLSDEQQKAADAFIDAAENLPDDADAQDESSSPAGREGASPQLPWQEPYVRDDVTKTYLMRMDEPLHLKLKYVSEKTGKSMNQLCNAAVEDLVESLLDEILQDENA